MTKFLVAYITLPYQGGYFCFRSKWILQIPFTSPTSGFLPRLENLVCLTILPIAGQSNCLKLLSYHFDPTIHIHTIHVYIYIYIYIYYLWPHTSILIRSLPHGIMVRVFTNALGDLGSISGRVIPKTLKWYLMLPCLTLSIIR